MQESCLGHAGVTLGSCTCRESDASWHCCLELGSLQPQRQTHSLAQAAPKMP